MKVTLLYVVLSVPLKLIFALALAMAFKPWHPRPANLQGGLLSALAARLLRRHRRALAASSSLADGLVNSLLYYVGINGPSWISNPRYFPLQRWWCCRCGSSVRR